MTELIKRIDGVKEWKKLLFIYLLPLVLVYFHICNLPLFDTKNKICEILGKNCELGFGVPIDKKIEFWGFGGEIIFLKRGSLVEANWE